MNEKSPQTFDDTPPIPKITIAKKKTKEVQPSKDTQSNPPKSVAPRTKTASKPVADVASLEKTIYDGYSTQLRTDIQQRLKRLKRDREEARHSVCTIKHFFELAILDKLDARRIASQQLGSPEKNDAGHFYTPFRTEIRRDLMRRIKRWKFEQEEKGQKGASIKGFLEEAMLAWLALRSQMQ